MGTIEGPVARGMGVRLEISASAEEVLEVRLGTSNKTLSLLDTIRELTEVVSVFTVLKGMMIFYYRQPSITRTLAHLCRIYAIFWM